MEALVALIFLLLGVSFGSFLNVVADRVPQRKSIVSPPSHCFSCGRALEARDMVPVVSYLALRGRCRYCKASIPARSLVVELTTGVLFALCWLLMGLQWQLLIALVYLCLLTLLSVVDLEMRSLPALIIYPALGVAAVVAAVSSLAGLPPGAISSGLGLIAGLGFFLVIWLIGKLIRRNILGFSDVLAGGLVGLMVGFPLVAAATGLALVAGGITAAALLIVRSKMKGEAVSLVPFLAFGAAITLLWGGPISDLIRLLLPAGSG